MSNKKVSELEEASAANEYDYLMIIQNGVNKKIQASKIGTGQSGSGGDTVPIGSIVPFASDTIPNGWLLCDGSAVSRTTYSELFAIIGTAHGIGDGSTTFNVPNIKGKVVVGKQQTMTPSGNFTNLGETGGEEDHTLTVDEIPSHGHDVAIAVNNTVPGGARYYFNSAGTTSAPISDTAAWSNSLTAKATGGGQAHNNLQPYIVENYIIKAKQTASIQGEVIQENDTATTENVYSASAVDNKLAQIIQSGSNANGSYIKYSDGTMICYGSTSLNEVSVSDYYSFCKRTNSLTITFPMEFDEVPNVTITNQGFGIFSYTINNITANNFSYYAFTYPSASNISGSLQYVAIGKWK